jgi:hypothetical protein
VERSGPSSAQPRPVIDPSGTARSQLWSLEN